MNILPRLEEVKQIAATGEYNVLPVSCEILSDRRTPIETLRVLKNVSSHCYMLESVVEREKWGRYTFLGYDPKLEVTCIRGEMKVGDLRFHTEDPSAQLRQILSQHKSPKFDYLPSFTGGLVGYFSYDYLTYSEPATRVDTEDTESFQDVDLMLFDKVIAFDNVKQKIILIVNMSLEDPETGYNKAVMELQQLRQLLLGGHAQAGRAGPSARPRDPAVRQADVPRHGRAGKALYPGGGHLPDRALQPAQRPLLRDAAGYLPRPADHEPLPLHVLLLRDGRRGGRCLPGDAGEAGGRHAPHLPSGRVPGPAARPTQEDQDSGRRSCWPTRKSWPSTTCWWTWAAMTWARSASSAAWSGGEPAHRSSGTPTSCTSAPPSAGTIRDGQGCAGRRGSGPARRHPLRCAEDPGLPAHRRAGGATSAASTAAPSATSTSPATSTPASPSASPIKKNGQRVHPQSGAGIVADSVPDKRITKSASTRPGPW